MKIVINAVLAQCILCYSQTFLQLTLELLPIMFIHNATEKKILHMMTLTLALKQRFIKLINGKSQTNWH